MLKNKNNTRSRWRLPLYYLILFFILLLSNGVVTFIFYKDLWKIVLEGQVFLFLIFVLTALLTKYRNKKIIIYSVSIILAGVVMKMVAALIYILPILLGDHHQKEGIALFFMINYLIYLNFSVVLVVRND